MKISVKLAEKIGREGTVFTLSQEDFSKLCRSPKLLKAWRYGKNARELEDIRSNINDIKQNSGWDDTIYFNLRNLTFVWLGGSIIASYFSMLHFMAFQIIFVGALMIPITGIIFGIEIEKISRKWR